MSITNLAYPECGNLRNVFDTVHIPSTDVETHQCVFQQHTKYKSRTHVQPYVYGLHIADLQFNQALIRYLKVIHTAHRLKLCGKGSWGIVSVIIRQSFEFIVLKNQTNLPTCGSPCLAPLLIVVRVSKVVIVREMRAGEALTSSQNDNQEIHTSIPVGMYVWKT